MLLCSLLIRSWMLEVRGLMRKAGGIVLDIIIIIGTGQRMLKSLFNVLHFVSLINLLNL